MNRRDFLKVAGTSLAAAALPGGWRKTRKLSRRTAEPVGWLALLPEALPRSVSEVLQRVPRLEITEEGFLSLKDEHGMPRGYVPLTQTQWNLEKSTSFDRLLTEYPWGIVLHWYGETESFDRTVTGYLRGFNGLRHAKDVVTRTSAHFLVGGALPATQAEASETEIGILQTQAPDKDGTPFVASHLRPLNYKLYRERKQYFVKALEALEYENRAVHSILQDFYSGPKIDPSWRTIAIEITGYNFDNPETAPSVQQMANVLGLVWAVMKRYQIAALDVLGHHEIELDKPDPGKLFMATLRYLLGIKALVEPDDEMKTLVFGRLMTENASPEQAVSRYFKFVQEYLVLVSTPAQVYAWEMRNQYWSVFDQLPGSERRLEAAKSFILPLEGEISLLGGTFLMPEWHEGVDLYPKREQVAKRLSGVSPVRLAADGECLWVGKSRGHCAGKMVIFRHRQADGAEVLTIYSHMSEISDLRVGQKYAQGYLLGTIASPQVFMERFLHFAVAYGATWERDLRRRPDVPLNASLEWIRERFMEPMAYIDARLNKAEEQETTLEY